MGAATYPLRGTPAVHPAVTAELRADLHGISLRSYSRWSASISRASEQLLPEDLRRKGDWYSDWDRVTSTEATDRALTIGTVEGDGFHFASRMPAELADLYRLMNYLAIPTDRPVTDPKT